MILNYIKIKSVFSANKVARYLIKYLFDVCFFFSNLLLTSIKEHSSFASFILFYFKLTSYANQCCCFFGILTRTVKSKAFSQHLFGGQLSSWHRQASVSGACWRAARWRARSLWNDRWWREFHVWRWSCKPGRRKRSHAGMWRSLRVWARLRAADQTEL